MRLAVRPVVARGPAMRRTPVARRAQRLVVRAADGDGACLLTWLSSGWADADSRTLTLAARTQHRFPPGRAPSMDSAPSSRARGVSVCNRLRVIACCRCALLSRPRTATGGRPAAGLATSSFSRSPPAPGGRSRGVDGRSCMDCERLLGRIGPLSQPSHKMGSHLGVCKREGVAGVNWLVELPSPMSSSA